MGHESLSNDPLLQVLIKDKEDQNKDKQQCFIRDLPMFPEPVVFLTNDQQLFDVERFCTSPKSFCALGVDATFQISDFYFTFGTYRNLLLETDKGVNPVCIGPGILHKRKLLSSYKTLPLLMTKYQPGLSGVLVYGTDGESNLSSALAEVIVGGKHLRCDIHLPDKIQQKIRSLGMNNHVVSEIFADIFGKNIKEKEKAVLLIAHPLKSLIQPVKTQQRNGVKNTRKDRNLRTISLKKRLRYCENVQELTLDLCVVSGFHPKCTHRTLVNV